MNKIISFEDIRNNTLINSLIVESDDCLSTINFTKHDKAHVMFVVQRIEYILNALGYNDRSIELAKIAGYMHDIGNVINRENHDIIGGQLAFNILLNLGMNITDICTITNAIGCHDSLRGLDYCSGISAALIIADKSDVRRSRVRVDNLDFGDIHTRVNSAVYKSALDIDDKNITLSIWLNTKYCSKLEYLEIFLDRMLMCRTAAKMLHREFVLNIIEEE